jgi:hypothetical protein
MDERDLTWLELAGMVAGGFAFLLLLWIGLVYVFTA